MTLFQNVTSLFHGFWLNCTQIHCMSMPTAQWELTGSRTWEDPPNTLTKINLKEIYLQSSLSHTPHRGQHQQIQLLTTEANAFLLGLLQYKSTNDPQISPPTGNQQHLNLIFRVFYFPYFQHFHIFTESVLNPFLVARSQSWTHQLFRNKGNAPRNPKPQ